MEMIISSKQKEKSVKRLIFLPKQAEGPSVATFLNVGLSNWSGGRIKTDAVPCYNL